jgi:hypothetical protein
MVESWQPLLSQPTFLPYLTYLTYPSYLTYLTYLTYRTYPTYLTYLTSLQICLKHHAQVSLLLIGQQGLGDFFRSRPLLLIGWRIVQILRQIRRKTTNTAPTTLSVI